MWLLYLTAILVLQKSAKTANEPSFLRIFWETHKKGTDFVTPKIAQKYVYVYVLCTFENESHEHLCFTWMINESCLLNWQIAEKVLGIGGVVKAKEIRGPYSTRDELEVEVNASRRKNEVLTDHLAAVKVENEKLQNHVESVETKMINIKYLVFQHFHTRPPSTPHIGDETPG
ncbi:hypothetical protein Cgig2_024033 [Carnegiea gigantea]|uniref:Uncharacterized protein n=1 Tax=Carnegiea gigantea TaxID=171969 RepID=A0A9Q1KJ50_9CARY|nr:hypothetical protein Cgig2_024033 [Carnegiea gigantea]